MPYWNRVHGLPAIQAAMVLIFAIATARAQAPGPPTNLQYFPKTTSREEVVGIMRGFSFSLGVRCEYCHVERKPGDFQSIDWALDDKETKKTARAMLRMVDAINQDYIAKLGTKTSNRVECVTCHHGLGKPVTMQAVLRETLEKQDIAAAVAKYRELRKNYYGSGAYDFGETSLNQFTESLLKQHKTKEAVAIMELNFEVNTPPSQWSYSLLAMSHKANQETDKAKADFQKILQMNPNDQWAKKQLEELNASKP